MVRFMLAFLNQTIEEQLFCWRPKPFDCDSCTKEKNAYSIVTEINLTKCTYYFMRFALDSKMETLCHGTDNGIVKVFPLNSPDPRELLSQTLKHPKCNSIVRDLSYSRCGKTLVYCCEDGTIWCWKRWTSVLCIDDFSMVQMIIKI